MKLTKETVKELLIILEKIKKDEGSPVDDVAQALNKSGIDWDIAMKARETHSPEQFFNLFDRYRNASYDECKAVCDITGINLLASMLSYEGRQLEHWSMGYGPEVYPFFTAGIESLLARCEQ